MNFHKHEQNIFIIHISGKEVSSLNDSQLSVERSRMRPFESIQPSEPQSQPPSVPMSRLGSQHLKITKRNTLMDCNEFHYK